MSCIFGIFCRDGSDPDRAWMEAMQQAMAYWNPDAQSTWVGRDCAMGHGLLHSTPRSRLEKQPLVTGTDGNHTVLVADARLDNREFLASELGVQGDELTRLADSDLLLLAWRAWSEACVQHLLGDFALVIWDESEQRLFCARDHVGIRPLYYFADEKHFVFSSDLRVLVAVDLVPREVDGGAVTEYLAEREFCSTRRTFLNGVNKVAPASTITVYRDRVEENPYWNLEESPRLEFESLEDCAGQLSRLLESAVHDRLQSDFPISSHLSGGVDSSAISTIAARHLAGQGSELSSFNWSPAPASGDDPQAAEWVMARQIAREEGIALQNIELDESIIVRDLQETDIALGHNCGFWYETPVLEAVQGRGGRVLLSGWGGDELISNTGEAVYADLFWHGRPFSALRLAAAEAKRSPKPVRRFLGILRHRVLAPGLSRREHCQRDVQLRLFRQGHIQDRVENWAATARKYRVEYSYPLLDKRVLEFALGVPPEYYRGNGLGRYLFREACKCWLPGRVRLSEDKSEPVRLSRLLELELKAISSLVDERARDSSKQPGREDLGWVDVSEMQQLLNHAQSLPDPAGREKIEAIEKLLCMLRVMKIEKGPLSEDTNP